MKRIFILTLLVLAAMAASAQTKKIEANFDALSSGDLTLIRKIRR